MAEIPGDHRTRVAVVGVGAVGGYFAAQAAVAGQDVVLCPRHPFYELRVFTDGNWLVVDAPVATEPGDILPVDWVLVATKAHQTDSARDWLASLCHEGTVMAVLQNGVEHVQRVQPLAGAAQVLPTIARYGGEKMSSGVIKHYTYGYLIAPDTDAGRRLAALWAVAARDGAALPYSIAEDEVSRGAALPDDVGSSTPYDRHAGRLEHDALDTRARRPEWPSSDD